MPDDKPTISLRLPKEMREKLDRATARTRRSRSFLMLEALERHLAEIEREQAGAAPKRRISKILSLAGAGAGLRPRTPNEIDAYIRGLRDDV